MVKADDLVVGKGVILAQSVEEAEAAVDHMLVGNAFGGAGHMGCGGRVFGGREVRFYTHHESVFRYDGYELHQTNSLSTAVAKPPRGSRKRISKPSSIQSHW